MSRTDPQFKLRMPPALRARVEQTAKQANRSLNAEIVTRLQASFAQAKPEVSANEESQPVPTPAAPRQLRLLCLLAKPKLGATQARRLPVHTLHRVPPRTVARGRWADLCDSCLVLREAHAVEPTAEVLARCERHRQTHALRAAARTVRTGGVSA
ncbi:UNVERIFIED_CONTAM: hypothetical protein NCL1_63704 [Trichonephila clavipes]